MTNIQILFPKRSYPFNSRDCRIGMAPNVPELRNIYQQTRPGFEPSPFESLVRSSTHSAI